MRMGLGLGALLLICAGLFAPYSPLLAAGCCAVMLIMLAALDSLWHRLVLRGGPADQAQTVSSNIIARSPSPTPDPALTIYLMAHHDSKGQSVSLSLRIILIITVLLGCISYGAVHLATALSPSYMMWSGSVVCYTVAVVLWFSGIVASLVLLSARTDNRSPGGLDNAGSVGVLLALADVFRHETFQKVEVVYVSTGAEELGLLGAWALGQEWEEQLVPERTWILNLDLLGVPGTLRLLEGARLFQRPHSPYAQIIRRTASSLAIQMRTQPILPGALLDHIPFSRKGFHAGSLICTSKRVRLVHTEKDTIDLVEPEGLAEAGRLVESVVRALDNKPA